MFYLFLLIPLPLFIAISYYLNTKKVYARNGNVHVVSILEGLGSFLIIASLLLEDFIPNPVLKVALLLLGIFFIAYTGNNLGDGDSEIDIQLETMKNIVVIFSSTILLFYVLLSVFRYQPFYIQISLALILTVGFNALAIFMKRWFSKVYDRLDFSFSMLVNYNAWYIFLFIGFIGLIAIFFNFPKVAVNNAINLNHSNVYYAKPDGSNDLMNYYEEKLIFDTVVLDQSGTNSYMNQDDRHLFIFSNQTLIIYDYIDQVEIYRGDTITSYQDIDINIINEEIGEIKYQKSCGSSANCVAYRNDFVYGGITYVTRDPIYKFENLNYNHTDTVIYNEDRMHFFQDLDINSRVSTTNDRPFVGFGESQAMIADVDANQNKIIYLETESKNEDVHIKVYQLLERDIDMKLPFYSHYQFGMFIFIFILGFIPVSNYDLYRTEISFKSRYEKK